MANKFFIFSFAPFFFPHALKRTETTTIPSAQIKWYRIRKNGLPCTNNCQRDHEISTISGNHFIDVYSKNVGRDM